MIDICKLLKEGGLKISLNQAKERASTATGVSKRTIERIMRRDKVTEEKPQLTRALRVQLDTFDMRVLWRTVNPLYSDKRIMPTLNNIQTALHDTIRLHRQQEYPAQTHAKT